MVSKTHTITVRTILPLLALLALPAAALCQTTKPASPAKPLITVSKETTWITEPLNADGTVNYVAAADAWLSKGVTRDNNAAILILQAFGREAIKENVRDTTFKRLGLTDFLDANTALVNVGRYVEVTFGEADRDQARDDLPAAISAVRKDPLDVNVDLSLLSEYVKRNDRALDLLVKASERPRYYVPYVSPSNPPRMMDCITRLHLLGWMASAKALICRGALRAREGKFDAALRDITAARKLGRLIQQETILINALVGVGVERNALAAMIGLATSGRLDKDQARALLASLTETPPMAMQSDLSEPIERFFCLDWITGWARDGLEIGSRLGPDNTDLEPEVTVPDVKIDYDLLCRLTNKDFAKVREADILPTFEGRDKARKAISTPTSAEVKEVIKDGLGVFKLQSQMAALIQRVGTCDPQRLTRLMHELIQCQPGTDIVAQFLETERAWAVLAKLSAAISVYHAQHGRYPAKLDALAPASIPAVPNDPFNDKPLTYRLTKKGYILYSVGTDMKDDGGKMDEFFDGLDLVVEGR